LVALTLAVECRDLVVEAVFAGAGLFGLVVEGVQAEEKPDGNDSEDTEGYAQTVNRRPASAKGGRQIEVMRMG